jgi:pimeloyl-ACP methyl ester carboxylesterase
MKKNKSYSIFKNASGEQTFTAAYDRLMELWEEPYETFELVTEFGVCHVIAAGPQDGKPALMFHGMTGNSALWYPTMEALKSYRTYCVDAPGDFGKSRIDKPIRSSEEAARWIGQLYDALGLEKATLVGHSMGGWLAANFALAHPERIDKLVLLAPVATFLPIPLLKMMRHIYPAMLLPNPTRIARGWNWFCSKGYTLPPAVMSMVIAAYTHCRLQLAVLPRVFPKEAWAKLASPVLFLVGDEEKIYDADKVKARVADALPHAEIAVVPRAGHCLIVERKDLVNDAIRAFLA